MNNWWWHLNSQYFFHAQYGETRSSDVVVKTCRPLPSLARPSSYESLPLKSLKYKETQLSESINVRRIGRFMSGILPCMMTTRYVHLIDIDQLYVFPFTCLL